MPIQDKIYLKMNNLFSPKKINANACTKEYLGYQKEKAIELEQKIPELIYENKAILEVGCGEGGLCHYWASKGAKQVIGVDISSKAINFANKKAKELKLKNCSFKVNDANSLTFEDNKFDMIISHDSVEHFNNPLKALSEMKRVLKPGRDLIIWVSNWQNHYAHHMPTNIPWAHILFSERTVMKHRNKIRGGTKLRYPEVGLNKMDYKKMKNLIKRLKFKVKYYQLIPTRSIFPKLIRPLTNKLIYIPFIKKYFISIILVNLSK
jgi:ubiquinone/menaquinone biosynthesis C-methylase UbiE